jgi:hypothetical protein
MVPASQGIKRPLIAYSLLMGGLLLWIGLGILISFRVAGRRNADPVVPERRVEGGASDLGTFQRKLAEDLRAWEKNLDAEQRQQEKQRRFLDVWWKTGIGIVLVIFFGFGLRAHLGGRPSPFELSARARWIAVGIIATALGLLALWVNFMA